MNFDLNIENYKKKELIDIFQLPLNYNNLELERKKNKLTEIILNNNNISQDLKTKTMDFLEKAKNILINIDSNLKNNVESEIEFRDTLKNVYNSTFDLKPVKVDDQDGHMIQIKKELPYLSSYPSEFFPGIINPLKKKSIP